MSYDVTTDAGKVRLLISDTDTANEIFSDAEIQAFLDLSDDSPFMAASNALRAIAGNEAQVLKVITLLDLTTNGAATAAALRALADDYETQFTQGGTFDYAEFALPPFGRQQRLVNQWQRRAF